MNTEAIKIYEKWTQMWNGNLDLADEILSPTFKAHLTSDSTPPPAPVIDIPVPKRGLIPFALRQMPCITRLYSDPFAMRTLLLLIGA